MVIGTYREDLFCIQQNGSVSHTEEHKARELSALFLQIKASFGLRSAASLLPKATGYLIGISFGLPAMNAMKTLNGYMAIDSDKNLPL